MQTTQAPIAQRSQKQVYFSHKDMDYYFAWILGRQIYEGCDPDECFAVAKRISDGDAQSWQHEWAALADQVAAQAERALQAGDRERARLAYLRACTYFRAPLFIMAPHDPHFQAYGRKMRACFQIAATLFDPPIERIQVPFRGKLLQGYAWNVDDSGIRRPTLIVVGGVETFVEDCYFMVGPAGPRRGYNVIAVDLPGQGVNPDQGLHFGARMEAAVTAVIDYALTRPDCDPQRLALFGFSWGGHIVFKGAQHDRRIRALIANPAMPDVFRAALAQQANHGRGDPTSKIVFEQIAWRFGLSLRLSFGNIARRVAKAYDYLRFGKVKPREISCPTLCMAGEGEAKITLDIARTCFAQLPHPQKKLVIFSQADGSEAHCQVDNLALPNGVMFDWLDEVFSSRAAVAK